MKSLLLSDTPYRSIDSCGTRKNYVLKEVELYIHFSGIWGFLSDRRYNCFRMSCGEKGRFIMSFSSFHIFCLYSVLATNSVDHTFLFSTNIFFLFLLYLVNCFNSLRFPIRYVKMLCWTTRPSFRYNESSDPPHRPRPKISRF